MFDLSVYHIIFTAEAQTPLHLGAQAGAQLRGTLWKGLQEVACTDPSQATLPRHARHCPACYLMALEQGSARGKNPPRPFTIRPPLAVRAEEDRQYKLGERFQIGMVLVGDALALFPYLVHGLREAGRRGVGYGRGLFSLEDICSEDPLKNERRSLLHQGQVSMPTLAVDNSLIRAHTEALPDDFVQLRFLTPTQIMHKGTLLQYPEFAPIIARILERVQALVLHYTVDATSQRQWQSLHEVLMKSAERVRCVQDNTRWVEVRSGSRRNNYVHDISGFVGEVRYEGDLRPFLPWLLWGQSLHVGKNAVKGNGWYELVSTGQN